MGDVAGSELSEFANERAFLDFLYRSAQRPKLWLLTGLLDLNV